MEARKYKLIRSGSIPYLGDTIWGKDQLTVYRIKALRDIPMHGVKKGDIGGQVTGQFVLSQEGECWIDRGAQVFGGVIVSDNAYIGERAIVSNDVYAHSLQIGENARIRGLARIWLTEKGLPDYSLIRGNVNIYDEVQIINPCVIEGDFDIYNQATILGVKRISGTGYICGTASVNQGAIISGDSRIVDNAVIEAGATVDSSVLRKDARVKAGATVKNGTIGEETANSKNHGTNANRPQQALTAKKTSMKKLMTKKDYSEDVEIADALNLLAEIRDNLHEYESDIVKILKYPAMADHTDPFTLDMVAALKQANRLAVNPSHKRFIGSVFDLEKKFLAAESNARRIASTVFTDMGNKKVSKAKDLLAIAANDASTEHEKKVAFGQAFKQLEGVIAVPDVAVDTFRVKIGLQEIQS
jgi:NDP-sugar pyrophosphorylase family protein